VGEGEGSHILWLVVRQRVHRTCVRRAVILERCCVLVHGEVGRSIG